MGNSRLYYFFASFCHSIEDGLVYLYPLPAVSITNHHLFLLKMKKQEFLSVIVLLLAAFNYASGQDLKLNDLEYFETQVVNVLVYNYLFTGGFNDEKNAGIELFTTALEQPKVVLCGFPVRPNSGFLCL